jgi:predicted anti-sigma-YlaC factor YlaD
LELNVRQTSVCRLELAARQTEVCRASRAKVCNQCEGSIRSYLDSYLNNELLVETNHEVLKHLETCEACSRSLKDPARLKDQLKRAVMLEYAPVALRERITGNFRSGSRFKLSALTFAMAAAAALFVIALTVPFAFKSNSSGEPLSLHAQVGTGDVTGQLLKIGFDDHVYLAVDHGMANRQFTVARMSERLGPEYAGLVEVLKQRMPEDYRVVVGHRCHYQGRESIHLIMRNQSDEVSLVITRKNGETFPPAGASAVAGAEAIDKAGGVPIYERAWQSVQVAGMETRDYLAFVVSNSTQEDNLQIASSLAPFNTEVT